MKKIIYTILGIFLMVACADDHLEELPTTPTEKTGEKVKVTFSVQIPEAQTAVSRSFEEPVITSLYLAVFDANGYLSEVVEATRTQGETELGMAESPIPFTVELSQTPNKRIIHFLANKTIDANDFGTENELIGALYTEGTQDAYWQRIELSEGIAIDTEKNINTIGEKLTKVPLIRNFAKITVQKAANMTTAGSVNFDLLGFTVVNVPDRGSIAPIKTNGGGFAQYLDANKAPCDYQTLTGTNGYTGFVPENMVLNTAVAAGDDFKPALTDDGNLVPFYLYERNNQAKNANRTFVIIKGRFGNEDVSYYKVDLTYKDENVTKYFEILRNFSYNIVIKNVESSGAASPELAAGMTGSHNNLSASIETQSLLNISDGAERLFVNYTEYVFVSNGEKMVLKYRYVPDISDPSTVNNAKASYSWDKTSDAVANITPIADAKDEGGWRALTVTAGTMDANGVVLDRTLTLVAGNLSRTVKFILRPKFNFTNEMATSPTPNNTLKGTFTYSFTIPDNIPESLFPMTFIVQADPENIYPNAELNSLPVKVQDGEQTFGYEREVTYEEYQQTGGIINCYFRVNTASYANTQIKVSNKYFNNCKLVGLNNNNNIYEFTNLIVNGGEAVPYGEGQSVTFTFNMPYVAIEGTDVTITANKMSSMSRATTFTYRATTSGTQTVTFTTAEFTSADRIKLEATNYITGFKAYDNELKIKANEVIGTTIPNLADDSKIRVYASDSDAKIYGDNYVAEVTRSILTSTQTSVALTNLTKETLLWFAYKGTNHIYVASATAETLASATANIAFNDSYEIPLEWSAELTGEQYYGSGKTVTLTLTTNKPGTYNVSFAEAGTNGGTATITVAQGSTTGTATYTTQSWSGAISAVVTSAKNEELDVTGDERTWLQIGKLTCPSNNNPPASNTTVYLRRNNSNIASWKWSEIANGTAEVKISNLDQNTNGYTFRYSVTSGWGWNQTTTYYTSESLDATQIVNDTEIHFTKE